MPSSGKRSRGCRGRRRGKARVRQTRCPNRKDGTIGEFPQGSSMKVSAALHVRTGNRETRRKKAELRFRRFITSTYESIDKTRMKTLTTGKGAGVSNRDFSRKSLYKQRLEEFVSRYKSNLSRRVTGRQYQGVFGLCDVAASFRKFLALKHGTWYNVLDLEESPSGEYNIQGEPLVERTQPPMSFAPPPLERRRNYTGGRRMCRRCGGVLVERLGGSPSTSFHENCSLSRRPPSVTKRGSGRRAQS